MELLKVDKDQVPRGFLDLNEGKLKKAILDGLVTLEHKWVQYKIDEGLGGTGR